MYRLYLWYSITFYWPPADLYGTLLTPAGSLHITLVLYHRLLATAFTNETLLSSTGSLPFTMVLYYLLPAHCLSLWYSTTFFWPTAYCTFLYWLHAYHYGTLLPLSGPLPMPMLLYYLLLDHCLYICYSTILYWLPAYTFGTLLSSTGSLPIHMVLFYLLLDPYLYLWYSIIF